MVLHACGARSRAYLIIHPTGVEGLTRSTQLPLMLGTYVLAVVALHSTPLAAPVAVAETCPRNLWSLFPNLSIVCMGARCAFAGRVSGMVSFVRFPRIPHSARARARVRVFMFMLGSRAAALRNALHRFLKSSIYFVCVCIKRRASTRGTSE